MYGDLQSCFVALTFSCFARREHPSSNPFEHHRSSASDHPATRFCRQKCATKAVVEIDKWRLIIKARDIKWGESVHAPDRRALACSNITFGPEQICRCEAWMSALGG